jgi:hypothetical protein
MKRLATAVVAACLVAGCGDDEYTPNPDIDPNDKRGIALDCIVNFKGIDAEATGENAIQVGDDSERDPRIEFFVSTGEAEGLQFKGEYEGTEHIGTALLFVREADDDLLEDLEECLQQI